MAPKNKAVDPFVQMSLETWSGLSDAVKELGWIADGGDNAASMADRDLAAHNRIKLERARVRVMERLTAYLAKKLSVKPPSPAKVAQAKAIAAQLAKYVSVNVKAKTVIKAGTDLLQIYASVA